MKKYLYLFAFLLVATAVWGTTQSAFAADTIQDAFFYDFSTGDGVVQVTTVEFDIDEVVTACVFDAADWTVDVPGSINVTAVTVMGCTPGDDGFKIGITTSTLSTGGPVSPVLSYRNLGTPNSITLTSGAMTDKLSITIDDAESPRVKSFTYHDTDNNGEIDSASLEFTEILTSTSTVTPNSLLLSDVGDFTGAIIGTSATDLITSVIDSTGIFALATESSAIDTHEDSGTLEISTRLSAISLIGASDRIGTTAYSANEAQTWATIIDGAAPVIENAEYNDLDADGMIDAMNLVFSETVDGGLSTLRAADLLFTGVGDFTGMAFGSSTTDLLAVGTMYTAVTVPLGTESSVVDTFEDLGTLTFSSQGSFSLVDADGNNNNTLAAQSQATIIDEAAPVVVSTTPVDGDTGVAVDSPVVLTFSESMDTTPSFTTFATSPVVTHAVTWSSNDTVATFDHTVDYANSTAISATLSDARDDIGNAIAGSTFVDFTTTAAPSTNSGGHSISSVRNIVSGFNAPVVVPTNTLRTALAAMTGLLKMGMKNDWVKTLQTFINTYATPTPLLVVDGAFGPKTDAAVKLFQAAQGIKIDGIVGPQTRTEMIAEIK